MLLVKKIILALVVAVILVAFALSLIWRPHITKSFEGSTVEFSGLYMGISYDNAYADGPTIARVLTGSGVVQVTIGGYRTSCQGGVTTPLRRFSLVRVLGFSYDNVHAVTVCKDKASFIKLF